MNDFNLMMGIHFAIIVAFITTGIVSMLCQYFDICYPQLYSIIATLVAGGIVEIFWLTKPKPRRRRR